MKQNSNSTWWLILIGVVCAIVLGFWIVSLFPKSDNDSNPTNDTKNTTAPADNKKDTSDCKIKGNISYGSGEKIYHLPGQKYYDSTTINEEYGERWFCTEAEAVQAGWRKSAQ